MPLDTSIPLQVRPIQLDDPAAIRAKGLQLRQLERAEGDAQRTATERQTIRDLYRSSVGEDGRVDARALSRGVAQAGLGDQIPDIQKGLADSRAAVTKADDLDLSLHKKRLDTLNGGLSSLLANPNVTQADVIAQINSFVNSGIITPAQGAEAARKVPGRPEQLRPFLVQRALEAADASKQLEAVLPKFDEQDRGGEINEGTIDPLTGQRTAGASIAKTATPGEKLTQERLSSGPGLTQAAIDLAAQRLLNGEEAGKVLANFGRGAQGAASIAAVQNRLAEIAAEEGIDARSLATTTQELAAMRRTRLELGAREGKIAPRVQEAKLFAEVAKEANAAVPRGGFVPWNRLAQMNDTQISSDPALAKLKAATLSLINAYAAAVGGGTPTVHDKQEAEKVLFTAQSPEAFNAVIDQLILETQKALEAPKEVARDLRRETTTQRDETPADIRALLQKHGGKP